MKTERAELKRQARQALKGHYGTAIGGYMLPYLLCWWQGALLWINTDFSSIPQRKGYLLQSLSYASFCLW